MSVCESATTSSMRALSVPASTRSASLSNLDTGALKAFQESESLPTSPIPQKKRSAFTPGDSSSEKYFSIANVRRKGGAIKKSLSLSRTKRLQEEKDKLRNDGTDSDSDDGYEWCSPTATHVEDMNKEKKYISKCLFIELMAVNKCAVANRFSRRIKVIETATHNAVFGRSLINLLRMEKASRNLNTLPEYPMFLKKCIAYLEDEGLKCEGLYRKAGSLGRMKALREKCDSSLGNINLYDPAMVVSPHDITGIVKMFIRELPEPIITERYTTWFLNIARLPSLNEKIHALQLLFIIIPQANCKTLELISKHLHVVHQQKETNKMPGQNLALLMGPNFMTCMKGKDKLLEDDKRLAIVEITEIMILNSDKVFQSPEEFVSFDKDMKIAEKKQEMMEIMKESLKGQNCEEKVVNEEEHEEEKALTIKLLTDSKLIVKIHMEDDEDCRQKSHIVDKPCLVSNFLTKLYGESAGDYLVKDKDTPVALAPDSDFFDFLKDNPCINLAISKNEDVVQNEQKGPER